MESVSTANILFLIQIRLAIQCVKNVLELAHGFGGAEEEKSSWVQSIVKEGNELLLQFPVHVDQHVATTEQVKFRERRVFDNVLLGKKYHVTDTFLDAVIAV